MQRIILMMIFIPFPNSVQMHRIISQVHSTNGPLITQNGKSGGASDVDEYEKIMEKTELFKILKRNKPNIGRERCSTSKARQMLKMQIF